jgi:TatD DNase family protein
MIDIGVNFHSRQLDGQSDELIERAKAAGVTGVLATGTSEKESSFAVALAAQYPDYVWATAGVHPHGAKNWSPRTLAHLEALWADAATVAIGEAGLDYNRMFSSVEEQRVAFEQQLDSAIRVKKPLFLHCRDAFDDFRAMTRAAAQDGAFGVVHCFTGTAAEAEGHLADGFDIGITGWVADPARGESLRDALKVIPLERMHLETDAPYLMPRNKPKRGSVNEPSNLIWVARAIGEVLQIDADHVAQVTAENSRRLFDLPTAR